MDKGLPIRAICRALNVIKAINRLDAPTLSEITREEGLPYPTTFRIVQTLIHEGIIEMDPHQKRYRPTELCKALSVGFQNEDRLVAAAADKMLAFTNQYLWPIALTTRVGSKMMIKHSTHTKTTLTFTNYYPGFTLPLLNSASGRAHLAFCPAEERERIMRGLENLTEQSGPEDRQAMIYLSDEAVMAEISEQGYAPLAMGTSNNNPGKTSSFSVPLFVGDKLEACLSLIFFASAIKMQEAIDSFLAPLKELADDIGAVLAE